MNLARGRHGDIVFQTTANRTIASEPTRGCRERPMAVRAGRASFTAICLKCVFAGSRRARVLLSIKLTTRGITDVNRVNGMAQ